MMADWRQRFAAKLVTAEEALAVVKAGQRVFVGSGAGEPPSLVEALSARTDLEDTEVVHILTLGVVTYAEPRPGDRGTMRPIASACRKHRPRRGASARWPRR